MTRTDRSLFTRVLRITCIQISSFRLIKVKVFGFCLFLEHMIIEMTWQSAIVLLLTVVNCQSLGQALNLICVKGPVLLLAVLISCSI